MDDVRPGQRRDGRSPERNSETRTATPELFERLVATIPEPVLVLDGSYDVVAGNDALEDVFGWPVSKLRDEPVRTLFPDVDRRAIEANCEEVAGEYVTCPAVDAEGEKLWVELAFERHRPGDREFLVGVVHDVTARFERERMLEQYERIVEAIDDGVYILDETFSIEMVNEAVESITGYEESDLVGANATLLADESTIGRAAEMTDEMLSGARDFATLTTELQTADGDVVPVETRFSPYRLDDSHTYVGVVRDISERRQFERTLTALHEATRSLLEAESADEVGQLVVDATVEILDVDGAAVYRFDRSANVLRRTAAVGADASGNDGHTISPGTNALWDSFVAQEVETVENSVRPAVDGSLCLPLGEYGVLSVLGAEDLHADTVEVLHMLAASAEAVLARVAREQSLRERDEELRDQNRKLRLHKEVNALIRRIDRVLVDADTREEIERSVCEQLASAGWVSFAWIGRVDGHEIEPRAWAGDAPGYLDAISLSTGSDERPPAVRAADADSLTVIPSISDDVRAERWRAEAVSRDLQSVVSVPLQNGEVSYGVLTVYGTEPSALEEMLQPVFAQLGDTIANAMREVESRQRRSAPAMVELELALSDPSAPLSQLADCIGAEIVCEGSVPEHGDAERLFFRVGDERSAETVHERATTLTRVESVSSVTGEDDATLFEALVTGETVAGTLTDQGVHVDSIRAETGTDELVTTVNLPSGVDVRTFVEQLDDRYRSARLVARREHDVAERTARDIRTRLGERLTDRQRQVLRTAYLSGFYDWPRECSGQELAEIIELSQPTMSRHLRVAERKLLDLVFDDV